MTDVREGWRCFAADGDSLVAPLMARYWLKGGAHKWLRGTTGGCDRLARRHQSLRPSGCFPEWSASCLGCPISLGSRAT